MGCALSSAEKEAVQRSLAIDKTLATENATKQNEIKLLLLGKPNDLPVYANLKITLLAWSAAQRDCFLQLPFINMTLYYVRVFVSGI